MSHQDDQTNHHSILRCSTHQNNLLCTSDECPRGFADAQLVYTDASPQLSLPLESPIFDAMKMQFKRLQSKSPLLRYRLFSIIKFRTPEITKTCWQDFTHDNRKSHRKQSNHRYIVYHLDHKFDFDGRLVDPNSLIHNPLDWCEKIPVRGWAASRFEFFDLIWINWKVYPLNIDDNPRNWWILNYRWAENRFFLAVRRTPYQLLPRIVCYTDK